MANLNYEKLYKSDFTDRLLDFVKKYEKERHITLYNDVVDWIIEEKIDCIISFLRSTPNENTNINQAILDERKALYEEFISFYE